MAVPTDVSGCLGWYDLSDTATLFQDTSRTIKAFDADHFVKSVTDKSGTGNHLSLASGGGPHLQSGIRNGLTGVRFGTATYVADDSALRTAAMAARPNGATYFVVGKKRFPTSNLPGGSPFRGGFSLTSSGTGTDIWTNNSQDPSGGLIYRDAGGDIAIGINSQSWHIISARTTGVTSLQFRAEGTLTASLNPNDVISTQTGFSLGGVGFGQTDWDFGEAIVYNRPLSGGEQNMIGEYLADKWGFTWAGVAGDVVYEGQPNLKAWYDFSDVSTLWQDTARTSAITADGQIIKGVTDKSGSANHLSEATNGPIYKVAIQNGLSISRYNGTSTMLTASPITALGQNVTAFFIGKSSGSITADRFLVIGGLNAELYQPSGGNSWWYIANEASGIVDLNSPASSFSDITLQYSSLSKLNVFQNGLRRVTFDPNNTFSSGTFIRLGANAIGTEWALGDIAEVLVYNATLTPGQINQVGQFLATKWGLTWNLVVTPPVQQSASLPKTAVLRNEVAQATNGQTDWISVPDWAQTAYIEYSLASTGGTSPAVDVTLLKSLDSAIGDRETVVPLHTALTQITGAATLQMTVDPRIPLDVTTTATGVSNVTVPATLPRVLGVKVLQDRLNNDETYTYKLTVRFE